MEQTIQTNIKGKNLRSSRSQMFFQIAVLRNFAELSRKCLCWSLYLIKLKAWRPEFLLKKTPTQVFSCEYFEIFKNCFFIEHLLFIILFQNFMWLYDSLDVFGYKIDIFYISWTIALSSIITLSEWVLHGYSVLAFIPEYLISVTLVALKRWLPDENFLFSSSGGCW